MNPQKWADRKCALCEHFSTSAPPPGEHDTPEMIAQAKADAAMLAKAGIGRCNVLEVSTLWSTVCIHFEQAPDNNGHRARYVAKQMAKQQGEQA